MVEQPAARAGILLIGLAVLLVLPLLVGSVISQVLGSAMVFVLLGLGLNIVVGYAGLLDLGYVAFFAFGAYMMAVLTGAALNTTTGSAAPAFSADVSFYIAIGIVVVLAAGMGLLIGAPVLRLRGDYLAIVTLGLGEIVRVLTESRWLQPLVGGPQGMRGVTDAAIAGFSFREPQHFYYLALAFVLLAGFVSWRLAASRIGRAWNAMREDEQVADAMGISITRYKLLALRDGRCGRIVGRRPVRRADRLAHPGQLPILVSITALAVVILGGLGSIPGVVAGAVVLIGLPGPPPRVRGVPPADLRGRARGDHGPAAAGPAPERPPDARAARGGGGPGRVGQAVRGRGGGRGGLSGEPLGVEEDDLT